MRRKEYWKTNISNWVGYSSRTKYSLQIYHRNNQTKLHKYSFIIIVYCRAVMFLHCIKSSGHLVQSGRMQNLCHTVTLLSHNIRQFPHHRGKVLFLSRPIRLRLMVVEQGTASRWWELLGSVGTHWLLLFAFCSLCPLLSASSFPHRYPSRILISLMTHLHSVST